MHCLVKWWRWAPREVRARPVAVRSGTDGCQTSDVFGHKVLAFRLAAESTSMETDDQSFIASSARLTLCFEVLDQVVAAKERALVFLDNLELQPKIAGLIQRRYGLGTTPEIISGEVAGSRRQARVDRFQTGPEGFDAMILSPRGAGVGLTITRANHVIHLSRWWNSAVEDQCTGRVLRIGQTRTVHIHVPLAILSNGPRSFDENLHALMERKRRLMREALLPAGLDTADQEALYIATINAT
jgi:hypothetical protein